VFVIVFLNSLFDILRLWGRVRDRVRERGE